MLLVGALLFVAVGVASAGELPDYIKICKRNDPDLNGCMASSIAEIQPYLAKGIPELNIPPMEPLFLKELVPITGAGLKVSAKNLKVYGASQCEVRNLKVDVDTLVNEFDLYFKEMYTTGDYGMKGKLLLLPLEGSGSMSCNATKITGHVKMQFEVKKNKDGMEYLLCSKMDVKSTLDNGSIHLDNLFGGDPVLGDTINNAINSNFAAFAKEFGPLLDKSLSEVMKDIANNVLKAFTYEQLFPSK